MGRKPKNKKKVVLNCIINGLDYSIPVDEMSYRTIDFDFLHDRFPQTKKIKQGTAVFWNSWPFCIYIKEDIKTIESLMV